jgi:hypothetical protein
LTIDELAAEAGTDARVLKLQLNRLSERDIRLLEADTPSDDSAVRYRLPHERLIPALYRLTGKLLAEVDQAKLKFQNAFQAWQTNDKRSRYLLKGKELRLVQRYETQIPWGHDEQEKKSFLFRGKRRRKFVWAAMVTALLVLIGAGWVTKLQIQQIQLKNKEIRQREYLSGESGYPAELYDYQQQLKKLEMTEPLNLERFTWLSSNSIEELSLTAAESSNSIAGLNSLSKCRSLKKLTLDLADSQVKDLTPLVGLMQLRQLTLHLNKYQLAELKVLPQLNELQGLTLDVGQIEDLQPLEQLKGLTQLQEFTIDILGNMDDWQPLIRLKELPRLQKVTLNLSSFTMSDLRSLEQLHGLPQLQKLALKLHVMGDNSGLKPLEQFKELTQLSLEFSNNSKVPERLEAFTRLEQLAIDLGLSKARIADMLKPLNAMPRLKELALDIGIQEESDLKLLEQVKPPQLRELTLHLYGRQLPEVKLDQLKELKQLSLSLPDLEIMEQLRGLTELKQLNLSITDPQMSDLTKLGRLTGLKQLKQLTLDVTDTRVSDLEPLKQLNQLTRLTLELDSDQVSILDSVSHLTNLQSLSIEDSTRLQRMSLRTIPPSLVELKF